MHKSSRAFWELVSPFSSQHISRQLITAKSFLWLRNKKIFGPRVPLLQRCNLQPIPAHIMPSHLHLPSHASLCPLYFSNIGSSDSCCKHCGKLAEAQGEPANLQGGSVTDICPEHHVRVKVTQGQIFSKPPDNAAIAQGKVEVPQFFLSPAWLSGSCHCISPALSFARVGCFSLHLLHLPFAG